jgi:hypothetical protein
VIRKTLAPMAGYALFAGGIGLFLLRGIGANIGTAVVAMVACFLLWLISQGIKAERKEGSV